MKTKKKILLLRRLGASLCALLCAAMLIGTLGACGAPQTPLMELDGKTLSVNIYQLLLSRVKGTLEYGGYNVNTDSFWDTVVALDSGITYDEYVRQLALVDAKHYLAASVMFDEEGLSLPEETEESIAQDIEDYIVGDANGSKSTMNGILSEFGANIDILEDLYTVEAKYALLRDHLYGQDGSKIAANVKQEYLDANAVCFRQILVRSYYYVYDTDANGDEIYYAKDENDGKSSSIAYDIKNGHTKFDEYGKVITDKNGDSIYYLADGKIAYDKENGIRSYTRDKDGNVITKPYGEEKLKENRELAEEIKASVGKGDFKRFEELVAEYESAGLDEVVASDEFYFLYTTGDNDNDYLNDIADLLAESEVGDVKFTDSDYGYNVVMKYSMPEGAFNSSDYTDWFKDFNERVINYLFSKKCAEKAEDIVVDDEVFASVPSMKEIGTNHYY